MPDLKRKSQESSPSPPTRRADPSDLAADRRLVANARAGDRAAIDALLRRLRFVPRLIAHKNALFGHPFEPNELDDLAQEVLISVWRKLDTYEGRSPLEPWIYRFVHLEMLHRLRCKDRRPAFLEDIAASESVAGEVASDDGSVESEALYRLLDRLSPPGGDVLRLRHLEDLSFSEIAQRLQVSVNTAKTWYYRGLKKARLTLGAFEREGGLS